MALVPGRQQFFQRYTAAETPAEDFKVLRGTLEIGAAAIGLRHDAGDRPAVAGDDDRFAALDRVEQPGQMRLGLGGLNLAHIDLVSTSRIDQSQINFRAKVKGGVVSRLLVPAAFRRYASPNYRSRSRP